LGYNSWAHYVEAEIVGAKCKSHIYYVPQAALIKVEMIAQHPPQSEISDWIKMLNNSVAQASKRCRDIGRRNGVLATAFEAHKAGENITARRMAEIVAAEEVAYQAAQAGYEERASLHIGEQMVMSFTTGINGFPLDRTSTETEDEWYARVDGYLEGVDRAREKLAQRIHTSRYGDEERGLAA